VVERSAHSAGVFADADGQHCAHPRLPGAAQHPFAVLLNRSRHQWLEAFGSLALFFRAIFASMLTYILYWQRTRCRSPHPSTAVRVVLS